MTDTGGDTKKRKWDRCDIGQRVIAVRDELGLSIAEMATELGYSPPFLYNIVGGKKKIHVDFLKKMYDLFRVNSNYLVHGVGSIFLKKETCTPPSGYGKVFGKVMENTMEALHGEMLENPRFAFLLADFFEKYKKGYFKEGLPTAPLKK